MMSSSSIATVSAGTRLAWRGMTASCGNVASADGVALNASESRSAALVMCPPRRGEHPMGCRNMAQDETCSAEGTTSYDQRGRPRISGPDAQIVQFLPLELREMTTINGAPARGRHRRPYGGRRAG